jgi:hypothetical protein
MLQRRGTVARRTQVQLFPSNRTSDLLQIAVCSVLVETQLFIANDVPGRFEQPTNTEAFETPADQFLTRGPILSNPIKGRNTSGISTEPSAC